MHDQPADLTEAELTSALTAWALTPVTLTHLPVGHGDHHWRTTDTDGRDWFLTVADLSAKPHNGPTAEAALRGLTQAMDTAAALDLDFVLAPASTRDGATVHRVNHRYALSVFPFVPGTAGSFGDELTDAVRAEVLGLLTALHHTAPPPQTPVHNPGLPSRVTLEAALADRGGPWRGGPYAEPARAELAQHATTIRGLLDRLDRFRPTGPLVLTHGEPHPGNLLRTEAGLRLLDWDTVGLAVPERDLFLVDPGGAGDQAAVRHYRLRWALEDVAAYIREFRAPHRETEGMAQNWRWFTGTLASLGDHE